MPISRKNGIIIPPSKEGGNYYMDVLITFIGAITALISAITGLILAIKKHK